MEPVNKKSEVLTTANELVNGDRNVQYGDPNADFKRIAAMWNILIEAEYNKELDKYETENFKNFITPAMVADMMICLKLSRNTHMRKLDNYVDIAGYAACGWACVE